ncbi:hypothetical protein Vi05172_g748 [Venturia inaequalis]|nr:hypothetical protein Vi05172_g748 [Venturia inaequalis]
MITQNPLVLILGSLAITYAEAPTVKLDSGIFKGTSTQLPGSSKIIHKYLGLPFAAPPIRFSPPQPPATSTAQRNATVLPPACVQNVSGPGAESFVSNTTLESEDCLYLNVFAPAPLTTSTAGGKTVMVWFFGGALQFGTGSLPGYDGTSFATNQDVILVAPNYRTNVFGFPGTFMPVKERNLGFLDQRMALDWVQQNIASFGGDPKKVTIFGQSAGARSVDFHLLTNNPKNPPFRAVIVQSGSARITPGQVKEAKQPGENTKTLAVLANKLGCTSTEKLLDCLRKVSASDIKKALPSSPPFGAVDDEGFTTVVDPEKYRKERRAANVSLLIGTTADEQKATLAGQRGITVVQYLDKLYGNNTSLKEGVLKAYPVGVGSMYKTDYDAVAAIATDSSFTCVTSRESKISAEAGYPTWRYFFNASFPNTDFPPGSGAYHSSEIPFVFGNLKTPVSPPSYEELSLSAIMQTTWADFAKDPEKGPGWAKVEAHGENHLGQFNSDGRMRVDSPAFADRNCAVFGDSIY